MVLGSPKAQNGVVWYEPVGRFRKYPTFEACGSKNNTFDRCWNQKPQRSGSWTPWVGAVPNWDRQVYILNTT